MRKEKPSVLMIGADRYALRACAALGADSTVVDSFDSLDSDWGSLSAEATRVLAVDDRTNVSHVLAALDRAGYTHGDFTAAVTTAESAIVATSVVGSSLGAHCIDVPTAVRFRDKAVQKRTVSASGIPTAEFITIEDIRSVSGAPELPWPKAVLKPVAGAAAHSTKVVSSRSELSAALSHLQRTARGRTFILEQFSPGDEWFLDGVMFHGELALLSIGVYSRPLIEMVTDGLPAEVRKFSPNFRPWMYQLGEPFAKRAALSLGLSTGIFHLEVFYDARTGELRFGEMAARRGGMVIQELVHYESGVDLALAALQAALGIAPERPGSRRPLVGGTYITAPPGTLVQVPSVPELMSRAGVVYARIDRLPGSRVNVIDNTDAKVAQAVVSGDDEDQVRSRINDLLAWAASRIVVLPDDAAQHGLETAETRGGQHLVPESVELYSPSLLPGGT